MVIGNQGVGLPEVNFLASSRASVEVPAVAGGEPRPCAPGKTGDPVGANFIAPEKSCSIYGGQMGAGGSSTPPLIGGPHQNVGSQPMDVLSGNPLG